MASNYPPQGPGQPNQPPPPYGQPGGQPINYGPPDQRPPNGWPSGQPSGQPPQYGQPPVAPTPPSSYGAPPPGGFYGPPPGAGPYSTPQGARPPYPQQPVNLTDRPGARPVKPKARSSRGAFITLAVIGVIVVIAVVLGVLGVFNNVDAADYPGATKAELTDKGTSYVNGLYDNKKSDSDYRKIFLTSDSPDKIFQFYKDDLTKKGWTFLGAGTLDQVPANQYTKDTKLVYVIVGAGSQGLVKDATGKNFIILLTGDKV